MTNVKDECGSEWISDYSLRYWYFHTHRLSAAAVQVVSQSVSTVMSCKYLLSLLSEWFSVNSYTHTVTHTHFPSNVARRGSITQLQCHHICWPAIILYTVNLLKQEGSWVYSVILFVCVWFSCIHCTNIYDYISRYFWCAFPKNPL